MALDRVQPVPWVLGLWMRWPWNHRGPAFVHSRSLASLTLWPPLSRTAQPYRSLICRAARSMSASVRMVRPERISPSGMLGVVTVARGSSSPSRVATASSSSSREPAVETITGSTTMFSAWYRRSRWAITSMSLLDETMPIFTASGRMSVKTMSIYCPRNSGVASMIPVTPVVFCAVSAVMALMAYTPFMVIVFRSA